MGFGLLTGANLGFGEGLHFWRFSLGFDFLNFRLRILGKHFFFLVNDMQFFMSPFWIFLDLGLWDSQKGLCAIRHLFPNDKMENGEYQVSMCLKTGNWLYIQTP